MSRVTPLYVIRDDLELFNFSQVEWHREHSFHFYYRSESFFYYYRIGPILWNYFAWESYNISQKGWHRELSPLGINISRGFFNAFKL